MEEKMVIVKAAVYCDAEGHYVPVAFTAKERKTYPLYDADKLENVRVSNHKANLMPNSSGTRIYVMGKYAPIKGIIEIGLVKFEELMAHFGFYFVCTIPCWSCSSPHEVYNAFALMLKGARYLSVSEPEITIEPEPATEITVDQADAILEEFRKYSVSTNCAHDHIKELVNKGDKILAIHLYRYAHGCGLVEAKRAVEEIAEN